jgi:hypothetical protein
MLAAVAIDTGLRAVSLPDANDLTGHVDLLSFSSAAWPVAVKN